MEVFLAAVARSTGISLFSDHFVRRILIGKAQLSEPKPFPSIVNTIDLWSTILNSDDFSDVERFVLQLMILLCARPSDLSSLRDNQVLFGNSYITVARFGTKADRRHSGTSVLIPITESVFIPDDRSDLVSVFPLCADLMQSALNLAFPGAHLTPSIIRKSSACILRQRGLPNRDIMEIGGWQSEDTLRKFYSRANTQWAFPPNLLPYYTYPGDSWPEMLLAR
jgi:integrase